MRRAFSKAAITYDHHAAFQREVGRKLLALLGDIPASAIVMDLGCGTGFCSAELRRQGVEPIMLDIAEGMLIQASKSCSSSHLPPRICADIESLPLKNGSIDILISNLAIQWIQDFHNFLLGVHGILRADGRLIFSTLGPGTLTELRQAWASIDDAEHVNAFLPFNQLRERSLEMGFDLLEMRTESISVSYPDVVALMRALKGIGAQNALSSRSRGLRGRSLLRRLELAYPRWEQKGGIKATYEVVLMVIAKAH